MTDYNASNERHIAIQRRSAKALEESYQNFVNHIMGMVDGRSYIHTLLTYCHVFDQPFVPDPSITAFGCGQLDVGQVMLRQIMRYCPDEYIRMMREANARTITDTVRRARSDEDSRRDNSGPSPVPYIHPAFDTADRNNSAAPADTDYDPFDEARGNED